MSDQTIQDVLYLIDAWERGAYADEYPTEIASLRQELAAARELKAENQELVEALENISLCSQNSMSSKTECGKIAQAALAKHRGQE